MPEQAVILAGGQGTRLWPITNHIPKPMIQFHERPFLEYLVEMLRDQGVKRILMLLGYLPEKITDHFGDGSNYGIEIEYVISSFEDETGTRLREAKNGIETHFLLMYCDNYWPLNIKQLWGCYLAAGKPAIVTIYNNKDGYTRDNLKVGDDGTLETYDKSRSSDNLKGVDIGFLICHRTVLDLIPSDGNPSFEATVYPKLVANRDLAAFVTGHRYYSVGSHERLALTNSFLARKNTILVDRDGTLNVKMPPGKYVCSLQQWEWIPGALDALRIFKEAGYRVIVVTNQPGIARNELTEQMLGEIHNRMISDTVKSGGQIDAVFYCPHDRDAGCECRKPAPGMLYQAQREFDLDLSRLAFIGDDDRDGLAAHAAGMQWIKVSEDHSILDATRTYLSVN